ncbi:E3 ubiquitin-protein ligase, ATL family [Zostera marina]|uniref:RING-type E3 ubiquitin transferase n=1 Tax=Zostera marina TaxID=29655 RepID=A0A0K9PJ96_ZOSMR|nr:E3 ubiquitin-protein ligase, ATL family [Zostera marina]
MPWFCSQSKRESEERFPTSLIYHLQKDVTPSSSFASFPQPTPLAPVSSSGSKINPVVLFIIVILAVIFFVSGLLHLLIRFLMKQKQPASAASPQSNTGYQRDISGSEALQRQLQQLFHLHDSGLDQSFIDALPIFLYKEIVGSKEQFDCAVCLCEFDDEDKLRLLPMCTHAFHLNCIDTWLLSNSTCPLCRGNLFIPGLTIENPVFDFNDDDGNLEDGSSLSLPALNQKAGDLGGEEDEEGSCCVVGKKKVFPVRLGKFKSVHSSNNPGGLVINNDRNNIRREEGESSSSNLDARRCYSMGSYQYVVGDSVLQVALQKGKRGDEKPSGGGSSSRKDPLPSLHAEGLLGKRLSVVGKGESFSVSKIWQWSSTNNSKGKFPIVSADTSSLDGDGRRSLPWI